MDLNPAEDKLKNLLALVNEAEKKVGYCPVGDICNHLFIIEGGELQEKHSKLYNDISDQIKDLNNQTLTVNIDQIKSIRNVIGIAGGENFKSHAILNVLDKGLLNILCTDGKTAEKILKLHHKKQA